MVDAFIAYISPTCPSASCSQLQPALGTHQTFSHVVGGLRARACSHLSFSSHGRISHEISHDRVSHGGDHAHVFSHGRVISSCHLCGGLHVGSGGLSCVSEIVTQVISSSGFSPCGSCLSSTICPLSPSWVHGGPLGWCVSQLACCRGTCRGWGF